MTALFGDTVSKSSVQPAPSPTQNRSHMGRRPFVKVFEIVGSCEIHKFKVSNTQIDHVTSAFGRAARAIHLFVRC